MKPLVAVLIAAGAIAGLLLQWPPRPPAVRQASTPSAPAESASLESTALRQISEEPRAQVERQWTASDLDAAIDRVMSLDDDEARKLAAAEVAAQLARTDSAAAVEVSDLFDIGRDDGTLEHTVQMWAEERLPEALKWAQSQPPGPSRDQLLARIALVQARRDPERAATLVAREMEPGTTQRDAALSVVREWAARDSEAAARWADEFPHEGLRQRAQAELARAERLTRY